MEQTARLSQWLHELPPLRFFGFGFCFAWGYLVWQTPVHVATGFADLGFNPVWLCSAIVSPLAGGVLALMGYRRDMTPTRISAAAAAILTFLGTCLLFCSSLLESAAVYFVVAVLGGF